MSGDLIHDLEERDLVHQMTSADLPKVLADGPIVGYVGFDPTADSLHVGSLVPVLCLMRLQRAGHRPIALVGGGTGMIGDPSGKQGERSMLTGEDIARNVAGMRAQLERFLDFEGPRGAMLLDNADWLGELKLIEFLRDTGKHFTVNQMVARDSVRPRLEDPERWISFTEFTYMLLQAYDFLALYDRQQCVLQMGGSDQWGNIVSGCDLIRRRREGVAHGLTVPLLTKADGSKFGKTETGNVWLDPARTSPYQFYQFWLNTADQDLGRYLRTFTFLSMSAIAELEEEMARAPQARTAQRTLAAEITDLVHGAAARQRSEATTAVLFGGGDWRELSAEQLSEAFAGSPRSELERSHLGTAEASLTALVASAGLMPSRGQARKAIVSGAIYVNNQRVADAEHVVAADQLLAGRFLVLRRGKKVYHIVEVS